jgi:hypothetical protein
MELGPSHPDGGSVQQFRVDLRTLKAFGEFVRRELDENIAPMATRVNQALGNGAVVGPKIPSVDLHSMNSKHGECVDAMRQQLTSYTVNMSIIADAAQAIASRYTSSDTLAQTTIAQIDPVMTAAILLDTPPGGLT